MKNITLLIGAFALMSCKNPQKEIKKTILYNDSIGYWNYEWPRDRSEFYGFTFKFDKNGKISKYSFSKIKNKRWPFGGYGDILVDYTWNISQDSILTYLGGKEKIIKYNTDTIWLYDKEMNYNSMLIKVKGDLNIEE